MTITLDDVSSLFHLPLAGSFFTASFISQQLTCITALQDLGVTKEHVIEDFWVNMGAHFRLSWLRDRYDELVRQSMYEAAARVYMLHLIGCIMLMNKSHVYIDTKYIWLISSLPLRQ